MKRKRSKHEAEHVRKRMKVDQDLTATPPCALLRKYYTYVVTLRQYLASRLSRRRRKSLRHYGQGKNDDVVFAAFLDATLIGTCKLATHQRGNFVHEDVSVYTQQMSISSASLSPTPGRLKQSEIVDFVVWLLFRRHCGTQRPKHILCQNFQRYLTDHDSCRPEPIVVPGIPGVYSSGPNEHLQILKGYPWTALAKHLGREADRIMIDMLLECGVFSSVADSSNLIQLSGTPLCNLELTSATIKPNVQDAERGGRLGAKSIVRRDYSSIRLVRHRILYARAASNSPRTVRFGLSAVHVLNRYPDVNSYHETCHIIKHIFPLQCGLHNVFSSEADRKDNAEPFKDYTLREHEIARQRAQLLGKKRCSSGQRNARLSHLPKRLRGEAYELVCLLRKRHSKCAYMALLEYYCPSGAGDGNGTTPLAHASRPAQVSAFCKAVIKRVFPHSLWGDSVVRPHNLSIICRNIDQFIRMRRFESVSLHNLMQDLKLTGIGWLAPRNANESANLSKSDFMKRQELMAELVYYLFDSFLIMLIRSNFHVTESSVQRNQLFYFRHDIWKKMSEPTFISLKHSMLEECKEVAVKQLMIKRSLGVSLVRLLPKETGMRPIINLRRRVQKMQHGRFVLGKSINNLLTPAFSVLNYEKGANPSNLGSAMFSVEDLYPKLQLFKQLLVDRNLQDRPLFFAKVDVQACFDNIPQTRLIQVIRRIISADRYQVARYSRAKLTGGRERGGPQIGAKTSWRFLTKAVANAEIFDFQNEVHADTAEGRTNTVYVNGVTQWRDDRNTVLALLEEHIEANLIKIGKRFYRQKQGIPQGSIVSSILCSFFYADLEREVLGFINDGKSLLLRLIDDFLVITTERQVAERFIRIMHAGVPQYGVNVRAEKSRTNFDVEVDGKNIAKLPGHRHFAYCGYAIHTRTLNLSRDVARRDKSNIADSMTIEYSRLPGESFHRKMLDAVKLQMRSMLLSTSYNSLDVVLSNLFYAFSEVARKAYHYARSLPVSNKLIVTTVRDVIWLASVLMKKRKRTTRDLFQYDCAVTNEQARWLACTAFIAVFQRRQTRFTELLGWLKNEEKRCQVSRKALKKATLWHRTAK